MVLHNININVNRGEMVFVVGRNGAGKTTLLKTIAGLIRPRAGMIIFEGEEIQGKRPEILAKKGIRYVAQDKRVFSDLSVRSNIELAAYGAGIPTKEAIEKALSVYPKLERFLDHRAGNLSGGQREILLIARALCSSPKMVLIDEPTEGLAAGVINDVYEVLNRMKANLTSIIVEQNLPLVSRLADRVILIKEGKVEREFDVRAQGCNISELEAYL